MRVWLQSPVGEEFGYNHQRRGNHGQMATAETQPVWTRMQVQRARSGSDLLPLSVLYTASGYRAGEFSHFPVAAHTACGVPHTGLPAGLGFLPTGGTALGGRGLLRHRFSSQGNWQAVLHSHPVVTDLSHAHETAPSQTSAAEPQTSPTAVSVLQNWMYLRRC